MAMSNFALASDMDIMMQTHRWVPEVAPDYCFVKVSL